MWSPFGAGDLTHLFKSITRNVAHCSVGGTQPRYIFSPHYPFQIILHLAVSSRPRMGQETRIKYLKSEQLQNKQNRPSWRVAVCLWFGKKKRVKENKISNPEPQWMERKLIFFFRSVNTIKLAVLGWGDRLVEDETNQNKSTNKYLRKQVFTIQSHDPYPTTPPFPQHKASDDFFTSYSDYCYYLFPTLIPTSLKNSGQISVIIDD